MDFDLNEYDQVDEVKLMMDDHGQLYCDGSSSKFMVTLSSCSEQNSTEDTNCENDFVFLPAPLSPQSQLAQSMATQFTNPTRDFASRVRISSPVDELYATDAQPLSSSNKSQALLHKAPGSFGKTGAIQVATGRYVDNSFVDSSAVREPAQLYPLAPISRNRAAEMCKVTRNPFGNYSLEMQAKEAPVGQKWVPLSQGPIVTQESAAHDYKPTGLVDLSGVSSTNPNKLAELMQQIVTKSDSIHIAIPCAFCPKLISCPPSNLTGWLNHVFTAHNCRVCPICNRLVGLGPQMDIAIMQRHVIGHFDGDWLDKKPARATFTHGLQQQWFTGNRCTINDMLNK